MRARPRQVSVERPGLFRFLRSAASLAAAVLFLPLIAAAIVRERATAASRAGDLPRVIWGLTPIINIKYWSEALREQGHQSQTAVWGWFDINRRQDFDVWLGDFLTRWPTKLLHPIREQIMFLWALRHADIFVFFFDGGFLSRTPVWRMEARLLHWAGKKLVMTPYGSDIAVLGHLAPFEEAILSDYPYTRTRSEKTRERVDHYSRQADLVIRNLQVGYLPRYDVVWPCQLAVDTDLWRPRDGKRAEDAPVRVVHAANHRAIKGTQHLLDATRSLENEGTPLRLDLLEGVPNEEVRQAVIDGDVVVEQLVGGFGLFAIEAMSAGKPVLSNMRWLSQEMKAHPSIQGCPIVDCDASDIKDTLSELVRDPQARVAAGAAGRRFALEHHSYDAVGRTWSVLLQKVWEGARPDQVQPHLEATVWMLGPSTISRASAS